MLRYLHSECGVLHCDISAGNVMYMGDLKGGLLANLQIAGASTARALSQSPAAGQTPAALPVFIKYLLRERYVYPHWNWTVTNEG